ncbi:MAG: hypothetical protein QNJ72_29755 [Pleurocapsa sp. MO_226.B13]|nr:hypothetical protein [Pleurocapsa sp. MO_226.B13]
MVISSSLSLPLRSLAKGSSSPEVLPDSSRGFPSASVTVPCPAVTV